MVGWLLVSVYKPLCAEASLLLHTLWLMLCRRWWIYPYCDAYYRSTLLLYSVPLAVACKVNTSVWFNAREQLGSNFVLDKNNERVLYCEPCSRSIKCKRESLFVQHVNTATHKRHFEEAANTSGNDILIFYEDLTRVMFAVNMLWRALNDDVYRHFLIKYTDRSIPGQSTRRRSYLDDCYD